MVEWLRLALRAWDGSGERVPDSEFVERLSILPGDPAEVEDGPGVARVRILSVAREQFDGVDVEAEAGARSEAFDIAVHEGLRRAAAWLDRQQDAPFEALRASGRKTDLFIGGWIDSDQLDLGLPPELLRACGRLGLGITICTND